MSSETKKKGSFAFVAVETVVLGVYAILCEYMYYMQTLKLEAGLYESDLPYHIEMALDGWGYSLTAIVYRLLSMLPASNHLIAIFLSLCTIAAILVTQKWVSLCVQNKWISFGIALSSGFVMAFFIRAVQYSRYFGYQCGSIWHNSTYIVMKVFAAATFFLYCLIAKRYGKKFTWKDWIFFAVLLAVTTATKTSFVLAFAPAALLMLGLDLYLKIPVKKVLLVATTVVPTIAIVLLQQTVLFGDDTGNGITIDFAYSVYLTTGRPYLTMPLSVLFPLVVLGFNAWPVLKKTLAELKERKGELTHRDYIFSWLMWFVGFAEYVLLRETGNRAKDGNFSWGYDFCIFILFVVSMVYFVKNLKDETFANKTVRIGYGVFAGAILLYHFVCGVYFFAMILQGYTYFL